MKRVEFCAVFLVAMVPGFGQNACKPVYNASEKYLTVPTHIYTTRTSGAKPGPQNSEAIYINGNSYVMAGGKWMRSPISIQEIQQEQKEKQKQPAACRLIRNEAVSGEPASVYGLHQEVEGAKIDSVLWISTARGLLLRQDIDMDVGGYGGKSHSSSRFEYRNVTAPAGVR